ncbi:YidC/Oxa1 family membrane protein insertase [Paludicola sp. MB14-C6]|uniref:YidC/Oxa1 family membrane protein insertase n=1 Tax=Paludihabitans sp. MB14-C6 TaxID=3070656 RepID=UPI0027DDC746|nr:YidC/Oxa1 family membrane protein insertase [Paludicola sp. MB14-C6]WMJ21784.1 YidC/Oxa1 family membrane protein insertase [Paludicola sp. MB14-C6]
MNFLYFLGAPLGYVMYWIFQVINNYGWSLIIFILLTRLALYPLSIKQQKSTAKMAVFQPKLKALEKKCGKDKQKYQEEMMKLYEQEGVSPTGGCLPMVVQFLLLFGIIDVIYYPLRHLFHIPKEAIAQALKIANIGTTSGSEIVLINKIQENAAQFSSVIDANVLDKIQHFKMEFMGFNLGETPQLGWNWLILIPILSGITAFATTWISMRQQAKNGTQMQGAMKWMMYFMPLMSVWFAFQLPAGVGLYWIVSNLFMVGQTYVLGRIYTPEKLANDNSKAAQRAREKMKKRRENLDAYNKRLEAKGKKPISAIDKGIKEEKEIDLSSVKEKDLAKIRLAEARKRAAEKYGDEYSGD